MIEVTEEHFKNVDLSDFGKLIDDFKRTRCGKSGDVQLHIGTLTVNGTQLTEMQFKRCGETNTLTTKFYIREGLKTC